MLQKNKKILIYLIKIPLLVLCSFIGTRSSFVNVKPNAVFLVWVLLPELLEIYSLVDSSMTLSLSSVSPLGASEELQMKCKVNICCCIN